MTISPALSQKVTARHVQRQAMLYILSRDFVGHMLTPYATFARLCIAQRNWRWTDAPAIEEMAEVLSDN